MLGEFSAILLNSFLLPSLLPSMESHLLPMIVLNLSQSHAPASVSRIAGISVCVSEPRSLVHDLALLHTAIGCEKDEDSAVLASSPLPHRTHISKSY